MNRQATRLAVTVIISFVTALISTQAFGWGREGHETIAKIAESNLNPRSRKIIENYLGNHTIVYFAKWMDDYRHTPEYSFTHYWHTVLVDEKYEYATRETSDALQALKDAMNLLGNYKEHTDSTVAVNLKYVIHLVGDMHCPAHIQYKGMPKDYNVTFGGGYLGPVIKTPMHAVWDKLAIQSCRIWSISEYASELDRLSKKEKKTIISGTPEQWLHDNAARCAVQFDIAPEGAVLEQDFINGVMPLIETQMLYAGYRLAAVLNNLF